MATLRIVGDVHGQTDRDNLCVRDARPYLEIIADAAYSIQVGDMGDGETYDQLAAEVDPLRHRFYPGNHDHYDRLPPHCLGDFGAASAGGIDFFFIRGAASTDRDKLIRVGRELNKTLWYPQEELTDDEMQAAEAAYMAAWPAIVLTHDAPTPIARFAWEHACRFGPPDPNATFSPSRTSEFLARLWEHHPPRLWLFGHYHRDWRYREGNTQFVCVGQLSYVDISAAGDVSDPN